MNFGEVRRAHYPIPLSSSPRWGRAHSPTFRHFTYVTTHSATLPSLYLCHNSFSNPSVASPTPQFILQPFFRFSYVTSSSLNSPGEPPMINTNTEAHFLSLVFSKIPESRLRTAIKIFYLHFRCYLMTWSI